MTMHENLTALVTYDVPSGTKGINAVATMRKHGFLRLNLSVWVGQLGSVSALPIGEWRAKGVNVEVVRFAPDDWENIKRLAAIALNNDVKELREFIDRQLERGRAKYNEAELMVSAKGVKQANSMMRGLLRNARAKMVAAQEAALAFDLLASSEDLFAAVRASIEHTESTFYAWRAASTHKVGRFGEV